MTKKTLSEKKRISRLKNTAYLSSCRNYRYALWRTWDANKPRVLFIALNPSTADETHDDPTLNRCINFAHEWGFGGLSIGNLFAFRSTNPKQLKSLDDPIGPSNDRWLIKLDRESTLTVAAWGNHGKYLKRADHIRQSLKNLYCLQINITGEPAHPLYLQSNLTPHKL